MVVFARMVAGHPPLLYTRNEDSKPGCPPQLFNDVGESPCQVAQNLLNPCGQQLADVLAGGTNHTICTCNTVLYSLASACMDCDDEYAQMARIAPFSSWVTDCGSPLRAMYPSSYNKPESQKPNVPSWAYNNLTSGNMFSLAAAVGDVSNPGAGWSPIQIVTPIIVGLGLSILFALFLLYRRHRKNGGKSFHLHVPTFVTSRLHRRRRRVRRYDDLPAVWSVDIDESDEIIPLEQPPRAVAPLRTSSPSSIPRTRANNVRTVPRRVGTLLQSVQRIFGRPIEVLAYTPGAHADIASNDGHEQPGVPGSSGDVIDPSDAAPPVPPKDPTSFWTFLKLSRLTEQLSQTSQKYGPVRSDDDDDDVAIVHFSNSGSESGADRRRGGQTTDLPASSRAAGPLQGAPTSSREVDARPGRTTSPSASVSRRPGGPRVQETVREAGDPNDRDSSASPSDTSVSIGKNAAQVAIAPSKLRSDHRGKRKSSGSALGALGAPFGISEVELPGDQEDDPDEHRLLNDAVTESAETEFFPPIMTFPTDSPTDSAALGTGESEKIPWRSRRNLSLANSHESSSAGARSNYSKRTGTSRTGTTFTSSSRDRRSLEGNPPTPAEIDGRRHSMFSYLLSSRHRSLPPAGSLLPPLPPQLQPSNGEGAKRREAKRKAEPPSAFPSTSLAALPIRESSAQAGGTPPLSTPSESPIVFTNETFHTAQAGSSPSGSFMNNGLPTPYASPPRSTPQPLPLPSISSEIPFSAMVDFALSQPSHAMMTPHANPNLVPPPPPLPLLPRLPPQPSTAATTTTTTGTGTTGTFWSDENPLGAPAPPNSSVSESPLAMSPIALSNPHSPRSRTRTRSISPLPSIPPVPLPASPAYSPPASAKSSSFSASQPQSPPASVGKSSMFSPSQAYSPPASASRPSFHSHSRSAETSSQASARARNISDLHSKSSFHTHSASASASLQASSASGSRVSLHSPPASKSPLHSPQPSHRALPQSPIPSVRPLPSPTQARKQLQQSPSATQTAFHSHSHPHSHSPSSSSIALASSSSSSLPRLSNSTLAPSDPRNLIPAHVRGAGYDPYHPIHESRWSSLMDNEE